MINRPNRPSGEAVQVQGGFAGDPLFDDPEIATGAPGEYTVDSVDPLDTPDEISNPADETGESYDDERLPK